MGGHRFAGYEACTLPVAIRGGGRTGFRRCRCASETVADIRVRASGDAARREGPQASRNVIFGKLLLCDLPILAKVSQPQTQA